MNVRVVAARYGGAHRVDISVARMAAAIPDLQRDTDRLLVFADEGNVVALIAWLKVHQLDLMTNEETRKHGIAFEVDFNNHKTVDISIKLDLTERVTVKTGDAGRLDIKHLAEIQHMPAYADEFWKLYDGDTLLAEWRTPEATP
ncbi:phage tail protein [Janthinobacterium sp. HSC-3S05]|uniref:phage tail protein n=1 Tax=Janthinobacterium lividum TaxID=29581 RepID=UPI001CD8AB9B|nr:phage tail protein [Janthinobacterium lividum]MCA1860779.1 phage tail protein [Janthinobacterium lividum]